MSRKSNIELLRILAMFLIVLSHYATHSPARASAEGFWGNAVLDCLSLGLLGVDIFVLITGYFVSSSGFKSSSFFRTLGKTYAYGVSIALVAFVFLDASPLACIESLIPGSIGSQQWFIAPFLFMNLFAPVLNIVVSSVSREDLRRLLLISGVCFSVLPGLFKIDFMMSRFVWFCFLYVIAAYYRRYGSCTLKAHAGVIFVASMGTALCLTLIARFVGQYVPFVGSHATFFLTAYSPMLLIAALSLFEIFTRIDIKSELVNKVASATFGVYLIHDNGLMRPFVWAPVAMLQSSGLVAGFMYTIFVYLACTGLDLLFSTAARRILGYLPLVDKMHEIVYPRFQALVAIGGSDVTPINGCCPPLVQGSPSTSIESGPCDNSLNASRAHDQ